MAENTQHKIDRVRPPRVQITYDVIVGENTELKELPFVVGIMADLSGMPNQPLPKMKDRKFVEIDENNFNDIMTFIQPRLSLEVDNRLLNDDSDLKADLVFESIDDFTPLNIVKQLPALAQLYEARVHLKDLLSKLDGNDVLEILLQEVIQSAEKREALQFELGMKKSRMPSFKAKSEESSSDKKEEKDDDFF